MEADPDPQKAVTDAVETKMKQTGTTMTAERKAQLLAMFTANAQQPGPIAVSVANIVAALGGARTRIGNSRFELSVTGGTINLYVRGGEERIGHISGPLQNSVALVETVKVEDAYQGQHLGKLLAVAYLQHVQAQGATHIGLGTEDTSGGFWRRYELGTGGRTPIVTAINNVGVGAFTIG